MTHLLEILLFLSHCFFGVDFFQHTTKEFSVPKVLISILPDKALDGKANRDDADVRMLEENSGLVEGQSQDQLFYTVRLRESELKAGMVNLKVPVYALGSSGEVLNANGLFFAKFDGFGFFSDCGDCVMVNGKAYINVSFDPQRFATNSGFTLELDKLIIKNDQQNCETSSGYIAKNLGMWSWGCLIVTTTNKLPSGLESVFPLPYKFTADLEQFDGKVLIGTLPICLLSSKPKITVVNW